MASPLLLLLLLIPVSFPLLLILTLRYLVRPRPAKIPIAGRHVFITGGSSGIGLALARQAAAAGARVSILARSTARLEEARDDIRRATGAEVAIYSADVRDAEAVRKAVEAAGTIDVLLCNHGVFVPQELATQDLEEVRSMLDVNVMGTIHLIKAALPGMRSGAAGPRSIAIVSSQAGQVGIYGYTIYSASKFALRGLAEALQQEVIMDDIHVSLIFPPDTETPGLAEENKRRPEVTRIIAGSSVGMKADDVAARALEGIKAAKFIVPCNLEGFMLSIATMGLSPQRSYLMAFVEVFFAGLMRFLGLCFQKGWYDIVEKCHMKKQKL